MSFQDDSVILSRLGILESKEESPHKIHFSPKKKHAPSEKDRFVEVNIDGTADVKSDSDEEPVFDRNSLLSPKRNSKIYRKRQESLACVYLILLLTYLAVGVGCPFSWISVQSRREIPFSFLLENSIGLLVGCFAARLLCQRVSLVFLLFLASASLCGLSWSISLRPKIVDARIVAVSLGIGSGSILYVGLATWLLHWRSYCRKALFLYVLISLGSSLALLTQNKPSMSAESLGLLSPSVLLHRRQASFFPLDNETTSNSTFSVESTLAKPKNSQVAAGIEVVETKLDKNEQMRKAVASNKAKATSAFQSSNKTTVNNASSTSETEGKPSFTISTTPSSPPILFTKRISESTRTNRPSSQPTDHSSIITINTEGANVRIFTIVVTAAVIFNLLASVFCCIPCKVTTDLKFLRRMRGSAQFGAITYQPLHDHRLALEQQISVLHNLLYRLLFDPSVAGLTAGCRLRLALVQIIASFLEGLVEIVALIFSTSGENNNSLLFYHVIVTLSRFVMMISGTAAFSLIGCCASFMCSLLGSALLLYGSASSLFGIVLVSVGTGTFGLLVFFYIEVYVSPRGGTQLDYFIFPPIVGRCLCTALATVMPSADSNQMIGMILLGSAPLLVIFWLFVKSLRKAARLKEIMEYSSSPVMEAVGEYVSLVERTGDYDSADDRDDGDELTG